MSVPNTIAEATVASATVIAAAPSARQAPSAKSAKITVLTSTNWMLDTLRNLCWTPAVTATNIARTTTMPDSLIRKTRSVSLVELLSAGVSGGSCRSTVAVIAPAPAAARWPPP